MLGKFFSESETAKSERRANANAALVNWFFAAELSMAFEKKGVFEYLERRPGASISEISSTLKLRKDLLEAACEFLAERGILSKTGQGKFCLTDTHRSLRRPANFLLAYKDVFESSPALMDGSKRYGKDVARDATRLGFATERAVPYLVQRLQELGTKRVLDLGCGTGNFLFALAEAIPDFRGIGIEIDKSTVTATRKRLKNSSYGKHIKIFQGDAARPGLFPKETRGVEALIGSALFHEFRKSNKLIPLLKRYKNQFPHSKFFLIEFDTPGWEELRKRLNGSKRQIAAHYLLTHYFSEQGLPQSKNEWMQTLREAGWHVVRTEETPFVPLVIFECE